MYAMINNSMGSGSVTYECEGHETRLSDCMSTLNSTIGPCYYALVKCFSTTDKRSHLFTVHYSPLISTTNTHLSTVHCSPLTSTTNTHLSTVHCSPLTNPHPSAVYCSPLTSTTNPGGSTTSGSSAGIVAGVVVSLLAVLLVVTIVIIILTVWLKRKDKNFKAGGNNTNPSYKPTTTFVSGTKAGNVTQLQENPSYGLITVVSAGTK